MTRVKKFGDWDRAQRVLSRLSKRSVLAFRTLVQDEAEELRKEIVTGLEQGSPGGKRLKAPSPVTLAIRRAQGVSSTKPLLASGELAKAIRIKRQGKAFHVGIDEGAKSKNGKSLVAIAKRLEHGYGPVVATPQQRRWLFAMMRKGGLRQRSRSEERGRGMVIKVAPRPFISPALASYKCKAKTRAKRRVMALLTLDRR